MAEAGIATKLRYPAQDVCKELMTNGASLEEAVAELREQGEVIAEFYIGGKLTYWTMGRISFGEPVWFSLYTQGRFVVGQRVCWEQMCPIMDQVHKEPFEY